MVSFPRQGPPEAHRDHMSVVGLKNAVAKLVSPGASKLPGTYGSMDSDATRVGDVNVNGSGSGSGTKYDNGNDIEASVDGGEREGLFSNVDPRVISDLIIGLSDGLTVPFALTAGLSSLGDAKLVK